MGTTWVHRRLRCLRPGKSHTGSTWGKVKGWALQASQVALVARNPPAKARDVRDMGSIPGAGRSLEEGMATHSSILAWRSPWTEEPGGLQSMGSQRARQDQSDLAHYELSRYP